MHFGNHLCPVTTTTIKIWNCSIAPPKSSSALYIPSSPISPLPGPLLSITTVLRLLEWNQTVVFCVYLSPIALCLEMHPCCCMCQHCVSFFVCVEKLLCRARQPASSHVEPSQPSCSTVQGPEVRAPRGGLWGGITRPTPASQSARLLHEPRTEARPAAAAVKLQRTERAWRSAGSGQTRGSRGALGRSQPRRRPLGPPASADGPQRLPGQTTAASRAGARPPARGALGG